MADFMSAGWAMYIAVGTVVSIIACIVLAVVQARARVAVREDGTVETTGHVWDEDLHELNSPLPRWWLYLFYITSVFGGAYLVLYPGLGTFSGSLGWSSAGQYEEEIDIAKQTYEPLYEQYLAVALTDLGENPEALAMGERLFLTYCSQCHGSDARGAMSFPNLTDADWLGEGSAEYIKQTILNGRNSVMPALGDALGGTQTAVYEVAHYVRSLSGAEHDAGMASAGESKFGLCAACHGADARGNDGVGAPNLTDDVWLHGNSLEAVANAIQHGIDNSMPSLAELLGEGRAHVLAAYVRSLSEQPGE